ncbi:hypothetical protein JJC03_15070 [Flavobacterium oreochromis]|nr:hypothetical protein [Flavobacterium oreochromis]QYS86244.1 hypothetical protein JJC03_15070 [Flavobacterium oreochromis]
MILKYLSFGISLVFISFIVGMITTSILRNTNFYNNRLSNFNFIKSEKLNSIMGVNIVKWIVKNTFFKYLNPNLKINGKVNISDFKNIREQMTKAEIDHLFAFLFVMIFVIIKIYNEEYILALIILILNILMNLCPTLLQQRNKRRIDKFISKFSK